MRSVYVFKKNKGWILEEVLVLPKQFEKWIWVL